MAQIRNRPWTILEASAPDGRVLRRWAGISRATRVVWDGRDAHGMAAPAGRATFFATQVEEHPMDGVLDILLSASFWAAAIRSA